MHNQGSGRSVRARVAGIGIAALALLAVSGSWAGPPDIDDGQQPNAYPADCPGRLHHAATAEPPAVEPYEVPPYGIIWGYPFLEPPQQAAILAPPGGYRAQIYHMVHCPEDPVGDRFPGLDDLVSHMGQQGLKFYKSPTVTMESGPDGIIAADDVVVIKINYQWDQRGGTNTDVLRGLIRRVVDHPDTFTGEIVVCENAQFNSTSNFNRANNNAQDHGLSPHDVVVYFQGLGYTISHFDWTLVRYTLVNEYSDGDITNGYVRGPYDAQLQGRVSYPKFRSDNGTYISSKYGIWDPVGETYDRESLKFINAPLLKSHHATYGATACVKHYMGVVTGELSTNSHGAIRYGILGALMGEMQIADLNILDCVWINANPYDGPWTSYAGATRRDELLASVDPVATDLWSVVNILIPAFIDNGYSPPWPYPSADPYDASSEFRVYLDNSMSYILAAGYDTTNSYRSIDAFTRSACRGDADASGTVDVLDFLALLAAWGPCTACPEDFDYSGEVDVVDFLAMLAHWGPCD
ncbi:MAG: DUF362 domain-containing protein [Planctomycetota bacterium]|jgi:uncharacterized protein (DUF362 family)